MPRRSRQKKARQDSTWSSSNRSRRRRNPRSFLGVGSVRPFVHVKQLCAREARLRLERGHWAAAAYAPHPPLRLINKSSNVGLAWRRINASPALIKIKSRNIRRQIQSVLLNPHPRKQSGYAQIAGTSTTWTYVFPIRTLFPSSTHLAVSVFVIYFLSYKLPSV